MGWQGHSQTVMFHLWHCHICAERRGSHALHKVLPKKYRYIKNTPSAPCRAVRVCKDCTAPLILSALRRQVPGETGDPTILSCPPLTGAAVLQGLGLVWWFSVFPRGPSASLGGGRGNGDVGSFGEVTLGPLVTFLGYFLDLDE